MARHGQQRVQWEKSCQRGLGPKACKSHLPRPIVPLVPRQPLLTLCSPSANPPCSLASLACSLGAQVDDLPALLLGLLAVPLALPLALPALLALLAVPALPALPALLPALPLAPSTLLAFLPLLALPALPALLPALPLAPRISEGECRPGSGELELVLRITPSTPN